MTPVQNKIHYARGLIFLAILVAGLAAVTIDWAALTKTGAKRDILTYVPADTVFFFGGTETASIDDSVALLKSFAWLKKLDWSVLELDLTRIQESPPAVKMIAGLVAKYAIAFTNEENVGKTLGVGQEVDSVTYAVGIVPVMRTKLTDIVAFNSFLDSAEEYFQVKAENQIIGGVTFRSYRFDGEKDKEPSNIKLIIGENSGYAVISLSSDFEGERVQKMIAGTIKPERSLTDVPLLKNIVRKHHYHPAYIAYLNHKEVIKGLTGNTDSDFGKMLESIGKKVSQINRRLEEAEGKSEEEADSEKSDSDQGKERQAPNETEKTSKNKENPSNENVPPVSDIQTPACRTELLAIAENWPFSLYGYTKYDLDNSPKVIESRAVLESKDAKMLSDLGTLRGYVPDAIANNYQEQLLGVGYGINVDALMPFLTNLYQSIVFKEFSCKAIVELQQTYKDFNPAIFASVTSGMMRGLKGGSFALIDFDGSFNFKDKEKKPNIRSIDALITVSSEYPQTLVLMTNSVLQFIKPDLSVPIDGSVVEIPFPPPFDFKQPLKITIKGKHIIAYIGEKAQQVAEQIGKESLRANHFYYFSVNLSSFMSFISQLSEKDKQPTNMPEDKKKTIKFIAEATSEFAKMNLHYSEEYLVLPHGIAWDSRLTFD